MLPDLINRNFNCDSWTHERFLLLRSKAVARTYTGRIPSWKRSLTFAAFFKFLRAPFHFSRRTLSSSFFFPPLSRFLLSRIWRRVLSCFVFNAQANVIVTSRRPCAKRAHRHRLMYKVIRLILSRAMYNSEIYCGVRFCGRITHSARPLDIIRVVYIKAIENYVKYKINMVYSSFMLTNWSKFLLILFRSSLGLTMSHFITILWCITVKT